MRVVPYPFLIDGLYITTVASDPVSQFTGIFRVGDYLIGEAGNV